MLFQKPFKIRSNVVLRESKQRKLVERMAQTFGISTTEIGVVFKNRVVHEVKLTSQNRVDVLCYLFDGIPFVFELNSTLLPTVFVLSLLPNLLPIVYIQEAVMVPLKGGADLMLPGVIRTGPFAETFNDLTKGSVCAISTLSGKAPDWKLSKPLAVGFCYMSNADVKASDGKGKFIDVVHVVEDKMAELCPAHLLASFKLLELRDLFLGSGETLNLETGEGDDLAVEDSTIVELDPDKLLMACFVYGLVTLRPEDIPLPVNVFYSKYMKTDCPHGSNLDMKKTSFKKVGIFLEKMVEEGFIVIETQKPGILQLKAVLREHPRYLELVSTLEDLPPLLHKDGEVDSSEKQFVVDDFYFGPPVFEDVRILTSNVAPFFAEAGYNTGDGILQSEMCRIAGLYVDARKLRDPKNGMIRVDNLLLRVLDANLLLEAPEHTLGKPAFIISFANLTKSLSKGLQVSFRARYPPQSGLEPKFMVSHNLPKVTLYQTKQGGKAVTRVGNLLPFGIDVKAFSRYLQIHLACSCNLFEDVRCKNTIAAQAQGDHAVAISKLLTGVFGFSPTWISGYVEAKKPKTKGKTK